MKFRIKYPFLLAALAMLALVFSLSSLGAIGASKAIGLLAVFQLAMFCLSRPREGFCFMAGFTAEQVEEFSEITRELKNLPADIKLLKKENDTMRGEINKMRKTGLLGSQNGVRWLGNKPYVSEDCARSLTSVFVLDCARLKGALELMVPENEKRQRLIALSASNLGMETRAALTTTEIPVPTIYIPQIVELVFAYGQARNFATVFPLGSGTVKLPRLKAGEDDFGYLGAGTAGMSQSIPEKKVTAELVTFTANKFGGLIRIPYELEEDTFVAIGQFLARYIARQMAKGEDKTLFLADGTATYANQTGVGPYCATNTDYLLKLDAGKTKISDITLDDIRNLRSKVSAAVLGNLAANGQQTEAAYYLSPTLEATLRGFNKYPNFVVFEYVNGKPMLDSWPVRWIGVSATNNGVAQPEAFAAFFGDLSFWYLAERGMIRIEVSKEVFFATDELALRALERIDVEAMAVDAMAALQLGAAA